MACLYPPPLTPDQISAVLDGTAEPSVRQHAAGCPECSARVDEARLVEHRLAQTLHRWDCPDLALLTDYYFRRLDAAQETGVAQHLQDCSVCRAELDGLKTFMADEPRAAVAPTPRAVERANRPGLGQWVARLLPQTPGLALRGETPEPLTAMIGEVLIVLEVEDSSPEGLSLVGLLATPQPERWTGALVQLWAGAELRHTALIDDVGGFRLEHASPGTAELRIVSEHGPTLVWSDLVLSA